MKKLILALLLASFILPVVNAQDEANVLRNEIESLQEIIDEKETQLEALEIENTNETEEYESLYFKYHEDHRPQVEKLDNIDFSFTFQGLSVDVKVVERGTYYQGNMPYVYFIAKAKNTSGEILEAERNNNLDIEFVPADGHKNSSVSWVKTIFFNIENDEFIEIIEEEVTEENAFESYIFYAMGMHDEEGHYYLEDDYHRQTGNESIPAYGEYGQSE